MARTPSPLPTPEKRYVKDEGRPEQPFWQWTQSIDALARALLTLGISLQPANYVLVITDAGGIVEMNLAGANTLTVPPMSAVPLPVGTLIRVIQAGAGITTLTAGVGVTLRARVGFRTLGQWAEARIYKRATDEWVCSGDLQV